MPEQDISIRHLRHLDRMHKRAELDDVHPGRQQGLGPAYLLFERDDLLLHLETVTQPDFVEDNLPRLPSGSNGRHSFAAIACAICRVVLDPPCLLYTSPSPRDGLLSRMPS